MAFLEWIGYVSPNVGQSAPCEDSFFNVDFPDHERQFVVDALVTGLEEASATSLQLGRRKGQRALLQQTGDIIVTEVIIRTQQELRDEPTVSWNLVTQPAIFDPTGMNLALDSNASNLNGTGIFGTVFLAGNEEGNLVYQLPQAIFASQPRMPETDGHVEMDVMMNIYLNDELVLQKRFESSAMTTDVSSSNAPVELDFDDFSFEGNFAIQQRRLHTARRIEGTIEFADVNRQIFSNMAFTGSIDAYGNVFGSLNPGSHINETGVAAYVTGSWFCDTLTLSLTNGTYQGECEFSIPSLQAGVAGSIVVLLLE